MTPERLAEHYVAADMFVLASRHEGYGMAFTEAIAHGLPVVGTRGGATAETVPAEAGLLVPPDDVEALTQALRRVLDEPATRARLAAGARAAAARLPRWDKQARLFARRDRGDPMSFSAEWLTLREPHDARARNAVVADALATHFADRAAIAVVDLACGTGASMRALSPHLPPRQSWRLVDNDLSLLARAQASADPARVTVTTVPVDLVRDLEAALDGALDLVTTSAFLDLVSADWLERLAVEAAARRLPVYAALTYDGRTELDPADPLDAPHGGGAQPPPAHRQGVRAGARPDRRNGRRRGVRAGRLHAWCRAAPTGSSDRPTGRSRRTSWRAARPRRASSAIRRSPRWSTGSRAGGAPSRTGGHRCGSVTSTCSPARSAGAEASDRSRTAPRRRADRCAPAAVSPGRRRRSARARSSAGRSRG